MLAQTIGGRVRRFAFAKGQRTLLIDNVTRTPMLQAYLEGLFTPLRVSSRQVSSTVMGAALFGAAGMGVTSITKNIQVVTPNTTVPLLGSMGLGATQLAVTQESRVTAHKPVDLEFFYYPTAKRVAVVLPVTSAGYVLIAS